MRGDSEVLGIDVFLAASKNREYRQLVRTVFSTLVRFLQENDLVTRELIPGGTELPDTFVLRQSDFTDEGFAFYRSVEQKWLGAIDRGTSPSDTLVLERALRVLRSGRDTCG